MDRLPATPPPSLSMHSPHSICQASRAPAMLGPRSAEQENNEGNAVDPVESRDGNQSNGGNPDVKRKKSKT